MIVTCRLKKRGISFRQGSRKIEINAEAVKAHDSVVTAIKKKEEECSS